MSPSASQQWARGAALPRGSALVFKRSFKILLGVGGGRGGHSAEWL